MSQRCRIKTKVAHMASILDMVETNASKTMAMEPLRVDLLRHSSYPSRTFFEVTAAVPSQTPKVLSETILDRPGYQPTLARKS